MVTAALANLTFMSSVTSSAMKNSNTVRTLVKAVRNSPFTNLFAKDQVRPGNCTYPKYKNELKCIISLQVVTVLANMAANVNCRPDIRAVDGVAFLLAMLETKANDPELTQAEMAAAERVQKKAAIAISRYLER